MLYECYILYKNCFWLVFNYDFFNFLVDCGVFVYVENFKIIYLIFMVEGVKLMLECVEGIVLEGNSNVFC